jgi:hypothetical protein
VLEQGLNWLGTPAALNSFLIDGLWLGVGTVATFMPLIFLFYGLIGIVEGSGYLPRAAGFPWSGAAVAGQCGWAGSRDEPVARFVRHSGACLMLKSVGFGS